MGYTKIGRIDVYENSFLGDSVIVLPNVTIGPNSIVGAGLVVTKDVSPNMVAAGNPARVISSLDVYLEKVRSISKTKGVFSKEYAIHMLDGTKRNEILKSLEDSIGFIL